MEFNIEKKLKFLFIRYKKNAQHDFVKLSFIEKAMVKYCDLVEAWSRTHNIISSKLSRAGIENAVVDSVVGGTFLRFSGEIFDAGSGGGLPGIPMALVNSDVKFNLIEADRKKCSFLRVAKSELNLSNVNIINERIENLHHLPYIVSKAAFSPNNMFYLKNSLKASGTMALWATPKTVVEYKIQAEKIGLMFCEEFPYELGNGKERSIVIFQRL
ncbi:MAG: 16S rRNA (guanine(527)-N(7))-methyltransferase RsmG [Myxococcales bacterium]|nr:16S rRNA (guanine(527)-N(7))-methyltransferase RsmG [Myxococcales bacterium]USN49819.1 MAG: 16S rRNA (guanine(527)-N(7))-methyltransferase RsmG [Myxococcales bacterium]